VGILVSWTLEQFFEWLEGGPIARGSKPWGPSGRTQSPLGEARKSMESQYAKPFHARTLPPKTWVNLLASDLGWLCSDSLDDLDYSRAGGDAVCEKCQKTLRDHPLDWRAAASGPGGVPYLHVLCDGSSVKL